MAAADRSAPAPQGYENAPKPIEPKPWTVMLYMAASQDEQTEAAAIRDLRELEKVGTTDNVNVVVQIDRKWPGYSERYRVWKGGSDLYDSYPSSDDLGKFFDTNDPKDLGEFYTRDAKPLKKLLGVETANELKKCLSSMDPDVLHKAFGTGNPTVLREFVRWTRTTFPAEHYLLVMWGHAFGLGFGRDHGDPLAMTELATALKTSVAKGERPVDILGANACAMSYAEAAYELKDAANFIVAPEIAMPFAGWPYEAILKAIDENRVISPEKLGEKILELFIASYKNAFEPRSVALTLLNLGKAEELKPRLQAVVGALAKAMKRNGVRDQIADAFLDTAYGDVRPLVDLVDLCEKLMKIDPGVETAAKGLRAFVSDPAYKDRLIVDYESVELEGLHGLGIFAPSVSGAADLSSLELSKENYKELSLVQGGWADLVYEKLNEALEPLNESVIEFVNGTGAVTREDRTGVAQLLLSVHRSFKRFESTLTTSEKALMDVLKENGSVKVAAATGKKVAKGAATKSLTSENGRVFGLPFLRLANGSGQQSYTGVVAPHTITQATGAIDSSARARLVKALIPLANIEDAVASVERTARKVLTHSQLGLGSGRTKPDLGRTKPDLGRTKPDLGRTKPDLGRTKPDLGRTKPDLGLLSASMLEGFDNEVTDLFAQVVWSLQLLEQAVEKLEGVVHDVLTSSTSASNGLNPDDYQRRLKEHLKSSFRELTDAAINAKLTLGAVLRHPSEGLGPTSQSGLGGAERHQLAMFGGLSPENLRLL